MHHTIANVEVNVARRLDSLDLPRVGARLQQASAICSAGETKRKQLTSTSHLPALKVISGAIDMMDGCVRVGLVVGCGGEVRLPRVLKTQLDQRQRQGKLPDAQQQRLRSSDRRAGIMGLAGSLRANGTLLGSGPEKRARNRSPHDQFELRLRAL